MHIALAWVSVSVWVPKNFLMQYHLHALQKGYLAFVIEIEYSLLLLLLLLVILGSKLHITLAWVWVSVRVMTKLFFHEMWPKYIELKVTIIYFEKIAIFLAFQCPHMSTLIFGAIFWFFFAKLGNFGGIFRYPKMTEWKKWRHHFEAYDFLFSFITKYWGIV